MEEDILGIHHISAIAGPVQQNVDYYLGLLGLRLVKKTVNFDDVGTYHLYYGDEIGRPGTILTFFPWANAVSGRAGKGMAAAVAFSIPPGAVDFWMERFADEALAFDGSHVRFGERVLGFNDPDGLRLELIASRADAGPGWSGGPVPGEYAVRAFHSCTIAVADPEPTLHLLTNVFGWAEANNESGRTRVEAPSESIGGVVDVLRTDERGRMGAGVVHHIAFRARNDEEQLRWRDELMSMGFDVTDVRDRMYFRSIYFREPGGVLFEIATDGPGFAQDEDLNALGTSLKLPPWLEAQRPRIEKRLPELKPPKKVGEAY